MRPVGSPAGSIRNVTDTGASNSQPNAATISTDDVHRVFARLGLGNDSARAEFRPFQEPVMQAPVVLRTIISTTSDPFSNS